MALSDLIPGVDEVKMALVGLVLCAAVGGAWYVHHVFGEVATLTAQVAQLEANQKQYAADLTAAKAANVASQATIASLLQERAQAQQAVTSLSAAATINVKSLQTVSAQLAHLMTNPSNNGPLSQDLKATIAGLQGASK